MTVRKYPYIFWDFNNPNDVNNIEVTEIMYQRREALIKKTKDENEKITNMLACVHRSINKYLSETIRTTVGKIDVAGKPLILWKYLFDTYGSGTMSINDKGLQTINIVEFAMADNESFAAYITQFEEAAHLAGLSIESAVGFIKGKFLNPKWKIQLLPDRLQEYLENKVRDNSDYESLKAYLSDKDTLWHTNNPSKMSAGGTRSLINRVAKEDKVSADGTLKCQACFNTHHTAETCKLDACRYCGEFRCGHKYHNCPKRSSSGFKKPKSFRKDDKSDKKNDDKRSYDRKKRDRDEDESDRENSRDRKRGGKGTSNGRDWNSRSSEKSRSSSKSRSGGSKKKSVRFVSSNKGDGESDDDDDDNDESEFNEDISDDDMYSSDDDEEDRPHRSRYVEVSSRSVRRVISKKPNTVVKEIPVDRMISYVSRSSLLTCIDTGCEDNLVPSKGDLEVVREVYDDNNPPPYGFQGPSGENLSVQAFGKVNDLVSEAFVSKDLCGSALFSGIQARNNNNWMIFPPKCLSGTVGALVIGLDGRVRLTADSKFMCDLKRADTYEQMFPLPVNFERTLKDLVRQNRDTHTVYRVQGSYEMKLSELVQFTNSIGWLTKQEMLWMAGTAKGYYVTEKQIQTAYSKMPETVRGNMKRRKVEESQYSSDKREKPTKSKIPRPISFSDPRKFADKHTVVGEEIGIDFISVLGDTRMCVTDRASGYKFSVSLKRGVKKDSCEAFKEVLSHYERYGHHVKQWNKPLMC